MKMKRSHNYSFLLLIFLLLICSAYFSADTPNNVIGDSVINGVSKGSNNYQIFWGIDNEEGLTPSVTNTTIPNATTSSNVHQQDVDGQIQKTEAIQVEGTPVQFPSPFSSAKHSNMTLQYTLSDDANIYLYIIDPIGHRIKAFYFPRLSNGGKKGKNLVVWDGKTAAGDALGSGIYIGTIVSRDTNKLLATIRISVYNEE